MIHLHKVIIRLDTVCPCCGKPINFHADVRTLGIGSALAEQIVHRIVGGEQLMPEHAKVCTRAMESAAGRLKDMIAVGAC